MEIENNTQNSHHLPEEIIEEILSRLAVKSLLRFKCVSKPWRYLIGSQRFITKHLENSKTDTALAHHRVMLCSDEDSYDEKPSLRWHCSLLSLFDKPDIHALEFNFAANISRIDSIFLVGCCNGLVCILLNNEQFVLWNPSTRISKVLPAHTKKMASYRLLCYGFCCDESSGDYKVVAFIKAFINHDNGGSYRQKVRVKIYSLKTDSWKTIRSPWIYFYCSLKQGKLASGKLHWEIGKGENTIIFDFMKEVFEMVKTPLEDVGRYWKSLMWLDIDNARTYPSLAEFRIDTRGQGQNLLMNNIHNLMIFDRKLAESLTYRCSIYVESLVSPEPSHQR